MDINVHARSEMIVALQKHYEGAIRETWWLTTLRRLFNEQDTSSLCESDPRVRPGLRALYLRTSHIAERHTHAKHDRQPGILLQAAIEQ
jgi:hypothetical protein